MPATRHYFELEGQHPTKTSYWVFLKIQVKLVQMRAQRGMESRDRKIQIVCVPTHIEHVSRMGAACVPAGEGKTVKEALPQSFSKMGGIVRTCIQRQQLYSSDARTH